MDSVHEVVRGIPQGRVASYGEVAMRAGYPGAARAVGSALTAAVPWWRVVRADGTLARGPGQAARLRAEGVAVDRGRIREPQVRAGLRPDPLSACGPTGCRAAATRVVHVVRPE